MKPLGRWVLFDCLLLLQPYTVLIRKVEIQVRPQMYLKKLGSISESFGANFESL